MAGHLIPPVLCYHRIGGPLELGVTRVGRGVFARQMTALARAGWRTLALEEFAHRVAGVGSRDSVGARHAVPIHNGHVPLHNGRAPRTFLLTFDDGYATLAEAAYPILRDLGFTATTFLITDYVGRENTWDARYTWRRLRHLDWPAIEHWQERGFAFGSHGATHRRLTWLPDAAVRDDLARARRTLISRLGPEAGRAVAYPFGAADGRIAGIARDVGHDVGFGAVNGNGGKLELPRVPVYLWDAAAIPLGLRADSLGAVGKFVAHVANRCAVGTTIMRGLGASP
ncbi:MAG: polysaccharide deacetylase family protein [Gemmatimonadales bacterium]